MPAEVDGDGDGYTLSTGDCDDTNPAIHPLAGDTFGDSIDQDCDGGDYDAVLVSTGAYYVIIPQWTDAMTAASKCVQLGYERLAEIHSHEEQIAEANLPSRDYLKKYENSQVYFGGGKRLWIGLQQKGNSFVWGSGTSSAYTSWYPSSPNGDGTCVEGDVAAHDPGFPGGGWNDIPCSQMMPFVCEKRK